MKISTGKNGLFVALLASAALLVSGCATKTAKEETGVAEQAVAVESTEVESEILPIGDSPILGNVDAVVTIVDFSSLQCPFCARGNETLKRIVEKYPDEVRIVSKSFPLEFQPESLPAAKAALAAGEQGKYWEMRDLLMARMRLFRSSDMAVLTAELADELGLDVEQFVQDFQNPAYEEKILNDLKLGASVGVRGTPHYFINGLRVSGAQPFQAFDAVINHVLVQVEEMLESGVSRDALYAEMVKTYYVPPVEEKVEEALVVGVKEKLDPGDLEVGNSHTKGPEDAPVTIYEFSSFQCPYCARGAETLREIYKDYPGKIRVVYKNFPLRFQAQAEPAGRAALAAGRQGKFWEYYDMIYSNQGKLREDGVFVAWAKELGLDLEKFEKDMDDPEIAAQVAAEQAEGFEVNVRGTPAFFINGNRLVGAQPIEKFKAIIDAELAQE